MRRGTTLVPVQGFARSRKKALEVCGTQERLKHQKVRLRPYTASPSLRFATSRRRLTRYRVARRIRCDRTSDCNGRISDLLKFLVPKVGESFVLGHNVESQEVAQARPRPELAGALETILELAAFW